MLLQIERDAKIGKIAQDVASQQKVEILVALKKLGETVTPQEESFLQANSSDNLKLFEKVTQGVGEYTHINY